MLRPFPAGLVGRAADRHAADVDDLEPAELELAHFVRRFETLQDDVDVHHAASTLSEPALHGISNSVDRADPSSQERQCGGASSATCRL